MTPLQKIKSGIETGNIALIAEGYNTLSNDKVDLQRIVATQNSRNRAAPPVRHNGQEFRADYHNEPSYAGDFPQDDTQKLCRVENFVVKQRYNMFADDHNDKLEDYSEKDKMNDEKFRNARRTPRRKTYTPVAVNCYSCGNRYNVNPATIIQGKYRCDSCNAR